MSAVVTLKKGEGRMVKSGGMWIFDNEIESVMGTFENGDLVLVHDLTDIRWALDLSTAIPKSGCAFSAEKKIQLLMKHFSGHDCSRHGNTGKDGRHLILSRGIWRGRFSAGTGY